MAKDKTLTAKSSVGDWLKHPVGGPLIRELLAEKGVSEGALTPVKLFSLQRVQSMGGSLTQEEVNELVRKVEATQGQPD